MGRLAGEIALISGASRGQGAAEARLFAAEGAAVVLTDVLDQEGDALATALRNEAANTLFRHLDVTSAQEWRGTIDYVRSLHGKLDILVNNAGIGQRSGLLDASLGEWETVLRVNLTGPFIGIQTAVPLIGRGGEGVGLADREAELLPVPYYHVVFTRPAPIADIAYQNKAEIYAILFRAAAETLITIAADPKHLGARIGLTAVLHTWDSALTHHPHAHCIVPGGGISLDGQRWISCRPGFFLPVRVLSRLFQRLFLEKLAAAHEAGRLHFFADQAPLAERSAFAAYLTPPRKIEWVVYAKRPFAGPQAVLAYLSRYTHRVAIANSRLIAFDDNGVTFRWKDYRATGRDRQKVMTLASDEFIRRFLIHVLHSGFHRIRHYGIFANGGRTENLARARQLLGLAPTHGEPSNPDEPPPPSLPCPCCGGPMIIIETFERGSTPRTRPSLPWS